MSIHRLHRRIRHSPILLFLVAVIMITGFFLLPANRLWVRERLFQYYHSFGYEFSRQQHEYRRQYRWGSSYTWSRRIAEMTKNPDQLVLVPPPAYFSSQGIMYQVPEPAVFYYYTGMRTTGVNSKMANEAQWYISVKDGMPALLPLHADSARAVISAFRQFDNP